MLSCQFITSYAIPANGNVGNHDNHFKMGRLSIFFQDGGQLNGHQQEQ